MDKSLRNLVAEFVEIRLVDIFDPSEIKGLENSRTFQVSYGFKNTNEYVSWQGKAPVTTMHCVFQTDFLEALVPDDPIYTELLKRHFPDKVVFGGWSKQKGGDEWDVVEALKICIRRASRDFADAYLCSLNNELKAFELAIWGK